jgi:hypothetical protein
LTGLAPLMPPLQFSFSMSCFKHTHTHTQIHNTHTLTELQIYSFSLAHSYTLIHTHTHTHRNSHTRLFLLLLKYRKNIPSFSGYHTLFLKIGTLKTLEQVLKKTDTVLFFGNVLQNYHRYDNFIITSFP